jgi:hypothetical protein
MCCTTAAEIQQQLPEKAPNNRIIEPGDEVGKAGGRIQSRPRLGGMLRYYYREAA